jgi:hypothetical protein
MIKSPNTILRLLRSKKTVIKVRAFTRKEKKENVAFCYTERGTIHIDQDLTCEMRVRALIHECLHLLNPIFPRHFTDEELHIFINTLEKKAFDKLTQKEYDGLKSFVT